MPPAGDPAAVDGPPDWVADAVVAALAWLVLAGFVVLHVLDVGRDLAQEALRVRELMRNAGHPHRFAAERLVQALGSAPFLALVVVVGAAGLAAVGRRRQACGLLAAGAGAGAGVLLLKGLVHHPVVSHELGLAVGSFPSGHAAGVTAVLGALLLGLVPVRLRLVPYAVALGVGLVVSGSRIVSGAHTPDDAAAGWLLGAAIVLTLGATSARVAVRRSERDAEQRVDQGGDPARS